MPRNVVNNAILKDEFLSLLNATSTAEQRQKWHDANEDYRCDECIENSQLTCTPNTNKSIRCAFCQDNKVYCTRADAERRATVKELLDLDDRQFDAIRGALEREGRYKPKGSGYLPLKERRVARAEVTDIDPTEQCVIRVPVGFEEIIKQAQAESQARISSFDSAVDLPIALREDFASEMSKRSSIKDHAAWNGLNPGAICSRCVSQGLSCTIENSNSINCVPCAKSQLCCSRKFSEARSRTMKLLELDEENFDLFLASATIAVGKPHNQIRTMSAAPIQRLRETTVTKRKRHSTTDNAVAGPSDQRNGRINRVSSDSHRPSANASSSASFSASRESTPSVMSSVPVVHTPRRPTNSDTEIDRLRQQLTLANDQNKKLEKEVSRLKALNRSASEEDTDEGLREHEKALQELADMTEKYQEKKREYDTEKAALVQKGIAEHTNLSVLRTRLRQLTNLFEAGKYSRDEMVSTCRNLCDQLQEVADRHLTQVPVGFSSILDAMAFDADAGDADDDVDEPPAKRRRL